MVVAFMLVTNNIDSHSIEWGRKMYIDSRVLRLRSTDLKSSLLFKINKKQRYSLLMTPFKTFRPLSVGFPNF